MADRFASVARTPDPPAGGRRGRGFTLVELLVAIWIMALVAVISWRGLSSLVATRERLGPEADEVRAMLIGFGQMERDLAQAANPVLASLPGPPMRVQTVDGMLSMQILRFSEPLPDGSSELQQVTYTVVDGALVRQSSPPQRSAQDAMSAAPATVQLVKGVASMQVRVWRVNDGWVVPTPTDVAAPPGVEVVLTRGDGTTLRRVLLVG
ncbi:MAG TPA: type II secretion system protein GspJ [Burkholderiaceae bacterium]|jgi:general secretion pathway protein J|nr:type II secretion system protein GspJ [Burkholderiaceae bacterium]